MEEQSVGEMDYYGPSGIALWETGLTAWWMDQLAGIDSQLL